MPADESTKKAIHKYNMEKRASLKLNLFPEEKKAFADVCKSMGTTPTTVLRAYMKEYVEKHGGKG